jgi:hypothetical protein
MSTVDGRHEQICALLTFDGNNAMYDNLKSLGISNPDDIDRYSLRQEANNDILKIYFRKDKGEFFAKSVKFKYPRQRKTVVADHATQGYKEVQEISPNLRYVIDELDQICQRDQVEVDLKRKILDDLRHLESVVSHKITEIESDLEKLTRNSR